jgi:hypothetical protein
MRMQTSFERAIIGAQHRLTFRERVVSGKDNQEPPVVLDEHRGLAAQKATDERRHSLEIEADQESVRQALAELERFLFGAPATTWPEAAERAMYLLDASPEQRKGRTRGTRR